MGNNEITYKSLLQLAYRCYLDAFNANRYLNKLETGQALANATQEELQEVISCLEANDNRRMRQVISQINKPAIQSMGVRELRDLARKHGVKNYSRLSKEELRDELKEIPDEILFPPSRESAGTDSAVPDSSGYKQKVLFDANGSD